MSLYLSLGANDGDRRRNLERAIDALVDAGFRLREVSPLVESPALLPPDAEASWHKPYLNLVIGGDADWRPQQGLAVAKRIEQALGRKPGGKWSPRPVDIDLLYWHDHEVHAGGLTIPHADAATRSFVLTPLMHLRPDLPLGENGESVFALTRTIPPIPLWMAVINLTPDSFSDGSRWSAPGKLDEYVGKLIERNIQIIDLGAESTRPGGSPSAPAEEWARLEPALAEIAAQLRGRRVKPWLAVDSRNPSTIEKALRYGVDIINDVTGLTDPDILELAKQSGCRVVAMHSVSVPADPARLLPGNQSALAHLTRWAEAKMEDWAKAGLDLNRIILDPGIGFGKNAIQAFELLAHCRELRAAGLRLLVGHSRKSFMNGMTARPAWQRDLETLGMSLALCQQGVDIIRVHSPFIHARAYLAWAHIAAHPDWAAPAAPQ